METSLTNSIPVTATTAQYGPRSYFFGPELRQLRTAKGLTVLVAASGIGIDPSMLSLLERRERGALSQTIERIEKFYGVAVKKPD